jgi:hypothetical protein
VFFLGKRRIICKGLVCPSDFLARDVFGFDEATSLVYDSTRNTENTGVDLLDVGRLFEADEAGKIKGKLKQLLKSLDEEDNPILMKVKF